ARMASGFPPAGSGSGVGWGRMDGVPAVRLTGKRLEHAAYCCATWAAGPSFAKIVPGQLLALLDPRRVAELQEHRLHAPTCIEQRVGPHLRQRRRVDMQRHEIRTPRLEVRHLVEVGVLTSQNAAGREVARESRLHQSVGGELENGLGQRAAQDAYGAGRAPVVVDGAALAVLPAQNQGVVPRTLAHQVARVAPFREADELGHLRAVEVEAG